MQEQVPEQDVVTQTQAEMDAEQGVTDTVQPLTLEQVKGLMDEQNKQISGIASKVDRGLNTMRGIAETAQQASGVLRSDMSFDQIIADMDEEQRAAMLAWRDTDRRANAPIQQTQEPAPDENWERVYRMAENMGLDRNDPNIRYTVITDTTLNEQQREQQFMASLSMAVQQKNQQVTAPPPTQPAPTGDGTINPPVDKGPSGTGSPMNNESQIMDALIEGRIDNNVYRERMAAIGITV